MNIVLVSIESSPSLIFPVMEEMLKQKGHICRRIHVSLHRYDDTFLKDLAMLIVEIGDHPGLIGISTLTNSFHACRDFIKYLRRFTDAKIVLGGIHPTVKPLESLEVADYVCVGEGEYALLELAEKLERGEPTHNIQNLYTKVNGNVITNPLRPLIQDLDALPVPSFDLKDFYAFYRGKIYNLSERPDRIHAVYPDTYFIMTSRGCPYICTYCLNSALIQIDERYRVIRRRSNLHVIQELKNFHKVYHKEITIGFVDDDFCAQSEENLGNFLELYKTEIALPFFVASTPHSMTVKKIKMLVEAGLTRLEIGIQSISDEVNKEIYKRRALKNRVVDAINMVSEYRNRIAINYDLILDNPWESDGSELETLRFLYTIPRPVTINMFSLNLYPGTELYYRAIREGKIKDEQSEIYHKDHMMDIGSDPINTLFILFLTYKLPALLIEVLIAMRKIPGMNWLLKMATTPLWKLNKFFCKIIIYSRILIRSIAAMEKENVKYLFLLPFYKLIGRQRRVVLEKDSSKTAGQNR